MKKVIFLINFLFFTVLGNAAPLLLSVKNAPASIDTKTTIKQHFHYAGHLLKRANAAADTTQPDAKTLSKQATIFALVGLALGVLGFMFAILWYTIASPALLTGLFIAGGIAGIFAIAKANKVLKNPDADKEHKTNARIAVVLGTIAVFIALLPAMLILLEPLLTT